MSFNSGLIETLESQYSEPTIFGGSKEIEIFDDSDSEHDSDKPVSEIKFGGNTEEPCSIIIPKNKKITKKELYKKLVKSYFK